MSPPTPPALVKGRFDGRNLPQRNHDADRCPPTERRVRVHWLQFEPRIRDFGHELVTREGSALSQRACFRVCASFVIIVKFSSARHHHHHVVHHKRAIPQGSTHTVIVCF